VEEIMADKLLRPRQLAKELGVSLQTIWRLSKEPGFPQKIQISSQAVGYRESAVEAWLKTREKS
jgi:predicted DNA-binding transcriptional regulator AlpA